MAIYSLVGTSLSAATSTGAGTSVFFGVPVAAAGLLVVATGSPASFNVNLEGTIDGAHYFTLAAVTQATAGGIAGVTRGSMPPVIGTRANLTAFSGGSSPTFTATVSGA
jgi:hypothetical protein